MKIEPRLDIFKLPYDEFIFPTDFGHISFSTNVSRHPVDDGYILFHVEAKGEPNEVKTYFGMRADQAREFAEQILKTLGSSGAGGLAASPQGVMEPDKGSPPSPVDERFPKTLYASWSGGRMSTLALCEVYPENYPPGVYSQEYFRKDPCPDCGADMIYTCAGLEHFRQENAVKDEPVAEKEDTIKCPECYGQSYKFLPGAPTSTPIDHCTQCNGKGKILRKDCWCPGVSMDGEECSHCGARLRA
jgi:hypothetical protein